MKAQKFDLKSVKTINEVLEQTQMNWIADQHELLTGSGISIHSHKALLRSDNNAELGIVGKGYEPVQNATAFAFIDVLSTNKQATYEYLYSINNGSRMIIQAKTNNSFSVRKGDDIDGYITMMNSFDGSTPFKVFFTPIRLFCKNQLLAAIRHATQMVSIRHTKTVMDKAEEAMKILGLAKEYFDNFQVVAKQLADKAITSRMVDNFLKEVLGDCNNARRVTQHEEVKNLVSVGKGNNGSSVWDLYNGVTEYVDHHRGNDESKRMANSLIGSGSIIKMNAWNAAVKLI